MKQTKRCVRCLKKAKIWSGHVLRRGKWVIAGWCSHKCSNAVGFCGQWTKKMGVRHVDT